MHMWYVLIIGRIVSGIIFIAGILLFLFSPIYAAICLTCGIGLWIICGKLLLKVAEPSDSNTGTTQDNIYISEYLKSEQYATEKYYKNSEKIESMWSVLHNLEIISGPKADDFERFCKENIEDLKNMLSAKAKAGEYTETPLQVSAYKRLAMLYEKQKRYDEAIDICAEAIRCGAIEDGSNGKMYGRLARLIRKSGIEVDSSIKQLIEK